MKGIVGLDHVQVAAPLGCEEAARQFYGVLLGLDELVKPPALAPRGGVWFRAGALELHVGVVADGFLPAVKAHPAFRVSSVAALEALVRRLEQDGVEVVHPDPGEIPGAKRVFVRDPWGNRLELVARAAP